MANDARGHPVPASTDHPSRASLLTLSLGIRDVIPVADTTARGTLITALSSAGVGASTSNPVVVYRADSATFEATVDGTNWKVLGSRIDGTYTPTWTSSGTQPVLNNGTLVGNYSQDDKFVDFDVTLTLGSTSTVGTGNYSLSAPVAPVGSARKLFWLDYIHSGSVYALPCQIIGGSTTISLFSLAMPVGTITAAAPVVPASGDVLHVAGRYRWA